MPELPEVETIRRGLEPVMTGARIERVTLRRGDLRFPFPERFAERLAGRDIEQVGRRAKYLLFRLTGGEVWLSHLGMTGSYRFADRGFADRGFAETAPATPPDPSGRHEHVRMTLRDRGRGLLHLVYTDARRFGFMDLGPEEASPFLAGLGPEPLGNGFNAAFLAERFVGRRAPVKAALLDQRVVAGLGNIYVSEALHRAHIAPTRAAASLVSARGRPKPAIEALVEAVRQVLLEAIEAGGSTLRDYRDARGDSGYFQHLFAVYGREGAPCPTPGCTGTIRRIVQSGRSSFYCPVCQR